LKLLLAPAPALPHLLQKRMLALVENIIVPRRQGDSGNPISHQS
jgi:hypothetical protein